MAEGLKLLISLTMSGTVLAVLTALATLPLRRRAPRSFRYYLWLLVLLRFLCPFGGNESLGHQAVDQSEAIWVLNGSEQIDPGKVDLLEGNSATMDWSGFLSLLWLGGALGAVGNRLWGGWRLKQELDRTATPVQPWERAIYHDLIKQKNRAPKLLRSAGTDTPMLTGLLRPKIHLPVAEMPEETLGYALRHELVHWRRKDLWYKYILTLAVGVHWFNPTVWLLARVIDLDCELSCDETVARSLSAAERADYGRTLIWAAAHQSGLSYGNSASLWNQKQCLKERIESIMKPNQSSKLTKLLLTVTVVAVAAASTALGAYAGEEERCAAPQPTVIGAVQPIPAVLQKQEGPSGCKLAWPMEDTEEVVLTSLYNKRVHPITGQELIHTGIDIQLVQGTPVLSSAAGTVQEIGFTEEYGNYIVLDHGSGLTTRYGCLEKHDLVKVGDTVSAETQIGTVGKTGMSTGSHLHFEVAVDGDRTDPLDHMPYRELSPRG